MEIAPGCKVLPCTCKSSYQDARYGIGRRIHNIRQGKKKGHTCTVCGRKTDG